MVYFRKTIHMMKGNVNKMTEEWHMVHYFMFHLQKTGSHFGNHYAFEASVKSINTIRTGCSNDQFIVDSQERAWIMLHSPPRETELMMLAGDRNLCCDHAAFGPQNLWWFQVLIAMVEPVFWESWVSAWIFICSSYSRNYVVKSL